MTTTEKVVGGIIVLGAIGGLVYVLKKDDKNAERTSLVEVSGEKVAVPDETTEAQKEKIVAIKEQKAMFVEKKFEPLVYQTQIIGKVDTATHYPNGMPRRAFEGAKTFKPMVFEPMGGRPETGVIPLGANHRILSKGSKGIEVEALQKNLGFVTKEFAKTARFKTPPNIIDGDFGQKTETALFIIYGVKSIQLSQLK